MALEHLASVAGLAPARTGLKGRMRELLCIHGRKSFTAEDERTEMLLAGRHYSVNPVPPWRWSEPDLLSHASGEACASCR
jgi:hypothetical protein